MSLRSIRKSNKMSQIELAEKSGIKQSTISQYECGSRKPSIKNAKRLADALGISLDEIFLLFNISN